jgi:isopenicillin-N epimerase
MPPHPAAALWDLRPGVTYLNHGSFGPSPRPVLAVRQEWTARLEANPMDFYVRQMEDHLDAALADLGLFVGTSPRNLVFVDNATVGMNIVARSLTLQPGDEVLANDHEYGAVLRIWRQACDAAGATLVVRRLPRPLGDVDELLDCLFESANARTRLLVVSHVASPTAVVFPLREICQRASERNIRVCVDGPHAPAAVDIDLDELRCDFYTASCHKWLSAPFGSGFLYVAPHRQRDLQATITSWGRSLAGRPARWSDEFLWSGTRDPAAFLAVPEAIRFLERIGLDAFREHSRRLIAYARDRIGLPLLVPGDLSWSSTMLSLRLPDTVEDTPPHRMHPLQQALWERHQIEVPIVNWGGHRWVRVSAHLYNDESHIDRLAEALAECP